MLPHQGDAITVEKKLKYLREIENIHRLSKRVLPPQGTTWARIADSHLRKALDLPVVQKEDQLNMKVNGMHHEHSPRTARLIERTLRNGVHHPDLLHSYRGDNVQVTSGKSGARKSFFRAPEPTADTPDVMHYIQHGSSDLVYPQGHLQGYGFVPTVHEVASHVPLEQATDAPVPASKEAFM